MSRLTQTIQRRARTSRSGLYVYVHAHFDEIREAREQLRATWNIIAEAIAADGQTNAFGAPPSGEAVRVTYRKVAQNTGALRGKKDFDASSTPALDEPQPRERPRLSLRPPKPVEEGAC
jgi:hypothetical protein